MFGEIHQNAYMGRPQNIPTNEVIRLAMLAFWGRGYKDCSLEVLERQTGMGRKGLYNLFSSKKGLLLASIRCYRAEVMGPQLKTLYQDDASYKEIVKVVKSLAFKWDSTLPAGCMVCNLSREDIASDAEVAREIESHWQIVLEPFKVAIRRAKKNGEIGSTAQVPVIATFLLTLIQGACVLERTSVNQKHIEQSIKLGLQALV